MPRTRVTYTHTCSACESEFQSPRKSPRNCPLCHARNWRWTPANQLSWAPSRILEHRIEPFVRNVLADRDLSIVNIHYIEGTFSELEPEWKTILLQKRLRAIINVLKKLEPTLVRDTRNDGIRGSHIFHRCREEKTLSA